MSDKQTEVKEKTQGNNYSLLAEKGMVEALTAIVSILLTMFLVPLVKEHGVAIDTEILSGSIVVMLCTFGRVFISWIKHLKD